MDLLEQFEHESWIAAVGTAAGYGLVLLAMFVVLFVLPYGIYRAL